METIWYCLVAVMIAIYVVLDGFDMGAGIVHLFVARTDRKSTRLNSSHLGISYAVFCLKKKNDARPATPRRPRRARRAPLPRARRLHRLSFFFNDTATTEIYPLSLHDALPI